MIRTFFAAMALFGCFVTQLDAGDGCCCPQCGCGNFKKVCKPVCDVKKETKFEYDCVCEDFCVPGPSRTVGHLCKKDCRGCEHCCPVRQPTCADVRTRMKLMKKAVTVETPTIKWVVQTVCCGCGAACGNGAGGNGSGRTNAAGPGCADGSCTQSVSAGGAIDTAPALAAPEVPRQLVPASPASFGEEPSSLIRILTAERP